MPRCRSDIVIVGGGPAGLIAGREASKKGAEVIIVEEHEEIGVPNHCAGLLSLKGIDEIGTPVYGKFIQNKIRGARFFSPSGLSFTVERKEDVACVVDRTLFDKYLAKTAEREGVNIVTGFQARHLRLGSENVMITGKYEELVSRLLIVAEGTSFRIISQTRLKPFSKKDILPALQFDIGNVNVDPDYVEIYFGERVAPGFFAWVIPLGTSSARVGLACKGTKPKVFLERFIKDRFGFNEKIKMLRASSGLIVTSGPIKKTYDEKMLVVGDAAGHVKPLTGGGVILGGICALIAGAVAGESIAKSDTTSKFLSKYEKEWKKRLGREFRLTKIARGILNQLSDKTLDKLFRAVIECGFHEEVSRRGDVDFQSGTILELLKRMKIAKTLPSAIGDLLFR